MKSNLTKKYLRSAATLLIAAYVLANVVYAYVPKVFYQQLTFDVVVQASDGQPVENALVRWGPVVRTGDQEQMVQVLIDWKAAHLSHSEDGVLTPLAGLGSGEFPMDKRARRIEAIDDFPGDVIGMTGEDGRIRFNKPIQQRPLWSFPELGSYRFENYTLYVYDGETHAFPLAELHPDLPLSRDSVNTVLTLP